jgi:hypothetical protein
VPRDAVRARYPGIDKGYESWFMRAADPGGELGFWIRYTVHCKPGQAPTGSLWFTLFDASAPSPLATKLTVEGPLEGDDDWIRIAAASLGAGRARGDIEVPDAVPVSWDLRFTGDDAFAHLPREWMYAAPLPRTKPVSLHPAARFEGRLTVGDRVVLVNAWPGMVGHNWGTEHAERWIWLHATGFEGDATAWLDVVLARLQLGPWTTPWTGFGGLCVDGELHRLGGLARIRTTTVDEHPDRATFCLSGSGGRRVRGLVAASPGSFVGWVYADPDGSTHDVVHCSVADLELTLERDGFRDRRLRSSGVAAYELGMRERNHGVAVQPFGDG